MIKYMIEAKIKDGKIDYKHSVNFNLEKPGQIDIGQMQKDYEDFARGMDASLLENEIKTVFEKFIKNGIEKTLTFRVLKNKDNYNLNCTAIYPFLGR